MNYRNFNVEDFAGDDAFISWVLKPDLESNRFWDNFRAQNPNQDYNIERARTLVLNLREAQKDTDHFPQVSLLWHRIDAKLTPEKSVLKSQRKFLPAIYRIAASLTIAMLIATGVTYQEQLTLSGNQDQGLLLREFEYLEEVNTTGGLLKLHLSDGSVVSLENNSRLRYPKDFTGSINREVYLTGEAFFDVSKNPKQPFQVRTKDITTKVLGTSFRVKAYENEKNIVVAVKEGKVSVFSSKSQEHLDSQHDMEVNGVVLTPNQQVIYASQENSFNKTLVESPEKIETGLGGTNLTFENAQVKEVFDSLGKMYGVQIIFDEVAMKDCYLTVPLGDEPLFEKLQIICRTIGASFELIETNIVVTSRGC